MPKPRIVGLIPARGGSKGVKNKNIRLVNDKPLIAYTIEAALNTTLIDRVITSTDSQIIANVAREWGSEVPFLRPSYLAQDNTSDKPVITHLIDWLRKNESYNFDFLVYLRPTTPLKTSAIIDKCLSKLLTKTDLTSIRTVTKSEGVFHPYWMFKNNNDTLQPFCDIDFSKYYQRQLLPACYRLNGVVDVLRLNVIKNFNNHYGDNIGFVEVEEKNALDIDTEHDLKLCAFLLNQ